MEKLSIEYYNQAVDAIQAEQIEEALTAVEKSLTEDPKDGQTWQLYVMILDALGRTEDAEKARVKLSEIGLGKADEYVMKASQAFGIGDLVKAREHYENAILEDPDDVAIRSSFALALKEMGDDDAALEQARLAVESDPEDGAANYALGHLLRLRGEKEAAFNRLTKAVKAEPGLLIALYEQGMLLAEKGETKAAIKNFETFLEHHPEDEAALEALRILKGETRDF